MLLVVARWLQLPGATPVPHIFKEETLLDFYLNSDCSINAAAD
jgi:hypothetical protein